MRTIGIGKRGIWVDLSVTPKRRNLTMSKKLISLLILAVLAVGVLPAVAIAAPPPQEEGTVYTVQKDDWLSKLAEKEYGDILAFPAIVYYTNLKAAEDDTFALIENADLIEVGWTIYLPTADEAEAFLSGTLGMAMVEERAGGGEIVVVIPEEPPHLDWADCFGLLNAPVCLNGYESLLFRDGQTGALVGVLAESWERVDETTWRFKLREDATFHNGVPFDAEIAKWNLETQSNPENSMLAMQNLGGQQLFVEVVDDYTIDVRTENPDPILPRRLSFVMMGEPAALEADTEKRTMVGTGPYVLDEWAPGERVVLVANPDYWGGEPEVKKATFVWRTEPSVRAAMLQAGESDIAAWLAPQDAFMARVVGVDIPETPFMFIDPNPPLDDLRVRKAICMAMDRDALADQLFSGFATPANDLVTPDVLGYPADLPVWEYDPEGAQALIEEAGADGVPVDTEITIYGRKGIYPNSTEAMEALQLWLSEIGLNVKLQMLEVSQWREVNLDIPVPEDRVGLTQSSHGNEQGDAIFTLQGYYGPYGRDSWYPYPDHAGGARRPVIDPTLVELIDSAALLTEGEGRAEALAAAFAEHRENVVWSCPMIHIQDMWGVSERVDWQPRFDRFILVKEVSLQ
jgi:peptide/nickel transport system substrate-binding protein